MAEISVENFAVSLFVGSCLTKHLDFQIKNVN